MANPFDDDMDVSSFYKPQNNPNSASGKTNSLPSPAEDFNFYERQIEQILQNTVDSSNRSVKLLDESEQIGIATGQDLISQGEKLQKASRQLDEISVTTKQSQKHLNNIKSIFGGIKNYFSKPVPTLAEQKVSTEPGKLQTAITKLNSDSASSSVPDFNSRNSQPSSLPESTRAVLAGTRWEVMNNQVDENLDVMSDNLKRLRELGSALGQEIDEQNTMLDKITVKADKADVEIRNQDKQMKKLLGGGGKPKQADGSSNEQKGLPSLIKRN